MNPIVKSLLEFNEAFEIPKLDAPDLGPDDLIELRIKLLTEEVQEYAEAARAGDLVEVLDALADIGYILAGTIINHGMQNIYDDAFNEVHRSNMAKLVDGKVIRREDGRCANRMVGSLLNSLNSCNELMNTIEVGKT